jgi:hypothetical protein
MITPQMFSQMNDAEARKAWSVKQYEEALAALDTTRSAWQAIKRDLTLHLERIQAKQFKTRFDHQDIDALTADLKCCEDGYHNELGATDRRVLDMASQPGLQRIATLRIRMQGELAQLRTQMSEKYPSWPRMFKYVGPAEKTILDGRWLAPGDVVGLNEQQAQSFGDRFEAVNEPQIIEA